MKYYKNYVWEKTKALDRCYQNAKSFETLSEARKYAQKFNNLKVGRAYFSKTDGSLISYREL